MGMSSRDRVLAALNHEEPDRVPLFVGASGVTSVLGPGYGKLRRHLGVPDGPVRMISRTFQYTWLDEEVMVKLGSDARPAMPAPPPSPLRRDISADAMVDDWGVAWQQRAGTEYFEVSESPLKTASREDIARHGWPDLMAPSRLEGLADRLRAIQQAGYATVLATGINLFEQGYMLRGMAESLMDIAGDEDFFVALLDSLKSRAVPYLRQLMRAVGEFVDIATTGDDLGTQDSTFMSPAVYRRLVKPREAEVIAAIKENSRAKVFFHSCGNIYPLIGDLADIGVDLLNPIQVSAPDMADTARLKREFGSRLSFCGGIDTQRVLPHGTQEEVRREVRRRISDLAPGGGYIAAAVHCIQPDVPPENVVAMCDEVRRAGRYPLREAVNG
jgi:uroporphyrinogen decarboxylase